jgi:hypothetical protein
MLDHEMGEWDEKTPATCTANGQEARDCKHCDHTEYRPIPSHGHDWTQWNITTNPTCTTHGVRERECTTCDLPYTQIMPPIPHTYVETQTKAPTCTTAGILSDKCACGHISASRQGEPALGHDWSTWETEAPPTCTAQGIEKRCCETCLVTETQNTSPSQDLCDGDSGSDTCAECNPPPPDPNPTLSPNFWENWILWTLAGFLAILGILFIVIAIKRRDKEQKRTN